MASCCGCSKETLGSVADRILAEPIRVCEVAVLHGVSLVKKCVLDEWLSKWYGVWQYHIENLCCFHEGKCIIFNYKWHIEDEFWGGQGSTHVLSVTHTASSTFGNKLQWDFVSFQ